MEQQAFCKLENTNQGALFDFIFVSIFFTFGKSKEDIT